MIGNQVIIEAEENGWGLQVFTERGWGAIPCHLVRGALIRITQEQGLHPSLYPNPEAFLDAVQATYRDTLLHSQYPKADAYIEVPLYGCKVHLHVGCENPNA